MGVAFLLSGWDIILSFDQWIQLSLQKGALFSAEEVGWSFCQLFVVFGGQAG